MTLGQLISQFVREHKRPYFLAAAMLASISVLTALIPRQVGQLIDGLAKHSISGDALLWQLGQLLLMGCAIYLLRVGWRLQLFKAAYRLGQGLRKQLYQRLSLHGPAFYQQYRTGDLMAMATNDIDAIEMTAGEAMLAGFDGTLALILVVTMMVIGVDWRLAVVALLPFPFMAWAFWYISGHIHKASQDALNGFGKLNEHVQESLAGVRSLRALGLEERSNQTLSELAKTAADASFQAQRWEAAYEPAVGITLSISITSTLALGGYLIWHDELTIGGLTSFSMYLGQLIWPMFAGGWVLALVERGRAALKRLWPVLSAEVHVEDEGRRSDQPRGNLRLQDVSFHYEGQTSAALQNISLDLPPGHSLGVVGATGSGKSTLIRLLLRQYSPTSGKICWGEHELREWPLVRLRESMSWVPQESFLFSASIADNIALARAGASRAEIEHVADLAAIDEDIKRFVHGYETEVGERGITLSGGQRQRVALARALLANCPLLLLDDALSAVDTGTETRILQHLQQLRTEQPERSVVIASHRLSAVVDCEHIIVLRRGSIIEQGTHAQLLELGGWYASQWRYQQLEASLDAS